MIKNNSFEVRKVNHLTAINCSFPILKEVGEFTQPLKAIYFKSISDYISIYHPGSDNQNVSTEFVELVFDNFYTLNPIDIFAFINYIKLNKPDVSGHKITPTELIQSLRAYIEQRQEAFEQMIHNRKIESREPVHSKVKDALQSVLDKIESKQKLKVEKINESIQTKIENQKERMEFYKSLRDKIIEGKITDEQGVELWNNFLTK